MVTVEEPESVKAISDHFTLSTPLAAPVAALTAPTPVPAPLAAPTPVPVAALAAAPSGITKRKCYKRLMPLTCHNEICMKTQIKHYKHYK